MATYDSQGVPVLGFHNPAGSILYPRGLYTYAMGNTRARDMTEMLGTTKGQHLDLLLLASGDIRNILCTVSELSIRKAASRPQSLSFHLNDYDPSVVARNAILLEVTSAINPDVTDDMDFLWNVWYNMTLSKAHFERLREILSSMVNRNYESDDNLLKFLDGNVYRECRRIWEDWKDLELDVKIIKQERNRLIQQRMQEINFKISDQCLKVISEMLLASNIESDLSLPEHRFYKEIEHWFNEGSSSSDLDRVNPTLIRPFVHKWKQHYGSCAFEGYLPLQSEDLKRCGSITAACKEQLQLLVNRFQQFKATCVPALKVVLWTGDALQLCTSGLPKELSFDVIDTSNVSDHIGLLNVLVCCGPRLKRPNESQLFTASMLWGGGCSGMKEYYHKCVGVPTHLLPTVLGLKLAVDFDLGTSKLPDKVDTTEEILCWVKAGRSRTVLSVDQNSVVVHALLSIVERCFKLVEKKERQIYGVSLPSPLTFLRIVQQIQPLIKGGATWILQLLEAQLPVKHHDFERKFRLAWNLLKASIGSKQEPIVEVKVQCDVSIASWFSFATPIPMIVIADQMIMELGPLQPFLGCDVPVEATFSVIYNSLRYDNENNTVTFHLCEKDWAELRENSWLHVVSSDLKPLVTSEPVFLGQEGVANVSCVDPVETFGLLAVQTFSVCSSGKDCQIVEVLKVEEHEHSYSAELAVLDSTKCTAKAMKISFQPTDCPIEVSVRFEGATGSNCAMYFSCPVEENTAKIQISRKKGKVFCQFLKKGDGTVGERVIQNPAGVPFHTLALWNSTLYDIRVCGIMFRTKVDQQLKLERKSGSPFFDLRESITAILNNYAQCLLQNKAPMIHCVENRETIEGAYQTPQDILNKKGLVIKVQELYRWKHLPVAKVLFYDCQRFGDTYRSNPTAPESLQVAVSFVKVAMLHGAHRIVADNEEMALFRKMLYTNAARVTQETESGSVWKSAFISLLFPRESSATMLEMKEIFEKREKSPSKSGFLPNDSQAGNAVPLPRFPGMSTGPVKPHTASPDNLENQASDHTLQHNGPECCFCLKKSETLKRCLGCKRVSYCGKDCQSRDWKKHKTYCKK